MKINRINSNLIFRENPVTKKEKKSENSILLLKEPNASIKFERNQEISQKADSIDTNPIAALGYKLYRTFNLIAEIGKSKKAENNFTAEA